MFFASRTVYLLASGPFGVPLEHLCAAGEGVSTVWCWDPQVVFFIKMPFFVLWG